MHETLCICPAILARYRAAPLFAEHERFLNHCAEQGYTRSGLQKIAWMLRTIAKTSIVQRRRVRRVDLALAVSTHRPSTRATLIHLATDWFSFMAQPQLESPPLDDALGHFLVQITCGCGARRIAEPEALARLCGPSATLEAVGKRMRCSRCGKKAAEVVAIAIPGPRSRR